MFEWTASGIGVFTITRRLQEGVPGPWGRPWTQGTIRRILRNEVYLGKLIWGRVNYERQPGTNKMVRRDPAAEPRGRCPTQPDLRIVSDELWEKVRARAESRSRRAARAISPAAACPATNRSTCSPAF